MKDEKNISSNLNGWVLIAIILCGFALYFLPLQSNSFYFDDHSSVENNQAIKSIDIPRIFNAFNTRFLVGLSFALNYGWCGLHAAGYRLINLLIHCLNAFLVYLLIKSTLYLHSERKPIFFGRLEWPAFFGSMLFLCHPIQTEPVNSITQRFVLMGSFFYLLTLFFYIQYRCRFQKRYLIAGMGSAIAAMFCKEFVITLPFMLVLYEFYFLGASAEMWWKRCRCILPFFIIVLIVPLLLLRTPSEAIGVANIADSASNHIDITRAHGGIDREQYFLTELNVVCTYVRLLFLPINQNLDYDYPISHVMDGKTLMSGMFLLCLLGLSVVTYKSYRIVSFGVLWFFIALSVESSFIPIGHVIAEYRLYLASVGFVFLIMSLIYMRRGDVKQLNTIAAVILIGLSILTYQRNKVWINEFALWNDTVQKSPYKTRPHMDRGIAFENKEDFSQAILDYNKVIEINPNSAEAYSNRAHAYAKEGRFSQAMSDCLKAIEINPNDAQAYNNRGFIYANQGHLTQAMSDYDKAIEINPNYAEGYYNRGLIYYHQHNLTQAMFDFNKTIEINPQYGDAYIDRGTVYGEQNNIIQAVSDYTKAIEINPRNAPVYRNRAILYYRLKEYDKAWADVDKIKELGMPVDPELLKVLKQASGEDN